MHASAQEIARAEHLRSEVTRHKRAIADHRAQLHAAKTTLVEFEARLRRAGIQLVLVPTPTTGVGDIHGRRPEDRST